MGLPLAAMDVMQIVIALVVGGLIGWVASLVMKTNAQMGLVANVIVGIVGSFIGLWLAGALGIGGGDVVRILCQIGGAVLLIALLRMLGVFK